MARGSYVANGNILPFSFVKFDTTAGATGKVIQAGSTDTPAGVSQAQQNQAPLTGLQTGYAAVAGENIEVFDQADPENQSYLRVDAAYAQGTYLKPGSAGIGTIAGSADDIYGARMMQASFAANDIVQVLVTVGWKSA